MLPSCSSSGERKAEDKGYSAFTFLFIKGQNTFDPKALWPSLHTYWCSLLRLGEADLSCSRYQVGGRTEVSAPFWPQHHGSSGVPKALVTVREKRLLCLMSSLLLVKTVTGELNEAKDPLKHLS